VGEALDHRRHVAARVDKTGIAADGAAGMVTGGDGTRIDFSVGCGERDGASGEHPRVEHSVHVEGGGSGNGGGTGGSVSGHSFVESLFQSCHGEDFAAG